MNTVDPHRNADIGPPDLGWVICELIAAAPGIAHAIVATADGRTMVTSPGLPTEQADQLAAITCGVTSITAEAGRKMDFGEVKQCVVEMARGYLLVMTVSDGSCLAVRATKATDGTPTDLGVIGYQMGRLVTRLGDLLTPALRAELTQAARR